jgi:hypothetical protein
LNWEFWAIKLLDLLISQLEGFKVESRHIRKAHQLRETFEEERTWRPT